MSAVSHVRIGVTGVGTYFPHTPPESQSSRTYAGSDVTSQEILVAEMSPTGIPVLLNRCWQFGHMLAEMSLMGSQSD